MSDYFPPNQDVSPSGGSSTDWIDSFLKGIPDITSGLSTFTQGLTTQASGSLTEAQGEADTAIYTQYLKDFPQYETYKETQYQTQENQTLADRLANMGMRGQTVGGAGAPTSAAAAYTGEQSLWDQGYTTLQNQLGLQQTEAEQKLKVATATTTAGQTEQGVGEAEMIIGGAEAGAGIGAAIGSFGGPLGTFIGGAIGAGVGAFAAWAADGFKV
jgi:hypothetical protein